MIIVAHLVKAYEQFFAMRGINLPQFNQLIATARFGGGDRSDRQSTSFVVPAGVNVVGKAGV
jgi:hypothetical protein